MIQLEHADIQGMIVYGYKDLHFSTYMFLHVADGQKARAWLARIIPEITDATRSDPGFALNIALTSGGLEALGLPVASRCTFPYEFLEGMADSVRAKRLGDTGGSLPEHWEIGGPAVDGEPDRAREIHMLLIAQAPTKDEVDELCRAHRTEWESDGGVREIAPAQEGYLPKDVREHFGFKDSIAQPEIEGSPKGPAPGRALIRAGEFVLGYPNEYDKLPSTPTVPAAADTHNNLRRVAHEATEGGPSGQMEKDLGRNGSYLVFRKLQQDVAGFRRYLRDNSGGDPAQRDLLGAKLVGRWPSGAPLTLAPDRDNPRFAGKPQNNDFGYMKNKDPDGYGCPAGAHIRRANPRDSLGGDPKDSLQSVKRHRILRRGVLYGDPLPDGVLEDDGKPRGILFFCINTDISRQFEFVQQMWIDNPKFAGLYSDKDPLIGSNRDPSMPEDRGPWRMTIPQQPVRRRLADLPRFVSVRGGGYFFLPGISALRFLAGVQTPPA